VQHADAFGGVQLVPGDRQQIDAEVVHFDGNLAERLGGVGVQQDAAGTAECGDLVDRLEGADLVLGVHDADQRGPAVNRRTDVVRVNAAVAVDRHDRHAAAEAAQEPARLQRRRVLDGGGDDVRVVAQAGEDDALDGVVARLAAAAGEDDLVRGGVEQLGDLGAGALDG